MASFLNGWGNVQYLEALSLAELLAQLKSIDASVSDCQFLVQGQKFYVVFRTSAKIVRIPKKAKIEIVKPTQEG